MTTVTIHYISKIIFARRFRFVRCLLKMKNTCFQKYKLSKRNANLRFIKKCLCPKNLEQNKTSNKRNIFSFSDRSLSKA
jgi:hypothetical protein